MILTLNTDLYKPDKNNYLKSLVYAKSLSKKDEKLVFHLFWRVPKDFGIKQSSVLKSIIINHIGNETEINLWSNVDLSENIYFKEISKYVNLKKWNLLDEIKGTILENYYILYTDINDELCYIQSDLFRLLVLHNYGGFYLDMDVLVLRNMSALNNYEFVYQWGTSGFNQWEPNITMNNAIMRLNKNSNLSLEFLELIKNTYPHKNSTSWGNSMYSRISKNNLLVLPGVWFDSEWGFEGTDMNPFKKTDNINLFDGAFAWHWHNRWDEEIEENSKFDILEKIINEKFNQL